ncbi:hypothetical protein ACFWY6_16115 [Streptomyces sp. NPDC059037]|uniref:hypothetical protein n=1 Tax=Streptomyces sp. NPDC059037 TaxID=3346710 RepID=UPI0036A7466D
MECVEQVVGARWYGQGPAAQVGGDFGVSGVDAGEAWAGEAAGELLARPPDDAGVLYPAPNSRISRPASASAAPSQSCCD